MEATCGGIAFLEVDMGFEVLNVLQVLVYKKKQKTKQDNIYFLVGYHRGITAVNAA